jgi:putative ABC transport system permease protein
MYRLRQFFTRVVNVFRRERLDADVAEQFRVHREMIEEDMVSRGMDRSEAEMRARRMIGNESVVRELTGDAMVNRSVADTVNDLRHCFRNLARKPAFTMTVILTLAISIGATTAMFSVADAVLLRRLPYKDPDRLVVIWGEMKQQPGSKVFSAFRDFQEWTNHSETLAEVAAVTWAVGDQTVLWQGETHRVLNIPVTETLFSVLGITPAHGRAFMPEDLKDGCSVVLSNSFWARLGASENVIGSPLDVDGTSCTVLGVMPATFEFYPKSAALWTLITPASRFVQNPTDSMIAVFGRLRPNVSLDKAQSEATLLHQRISSEASPGSWIRETSPVVYPLQSEFTWMAGRNLKTSILALFAAVGILLLIACVNVANLLLSRCAEREAEFAIRAALGCGRGRLIRQLLTESFLLAALGALPGILLAWACVKYCRISNPFELPPGTELSINWHFMAFVVLTAALTGVLFGIVPAWQMSRLDLHAVMRKGGRNVMPGINKSGNVLVAAEVALSVILLFGAGLMIESIDRLASAPLGFATEHVLVAGIHLPVGSYGQIVERAEFYDRVMARMRTLPGVEDAAVSSAAPLSGTGTNAISISGSPPAPNELGDVSIRQVSAGYFRTMRIPMVRGRDFDSRDQESKAQVAVINQKLADNYFGGVDPVGKQIRIGSPDIPGPWFTIVGIASNVAQTNVLNEMNYQMGPIVYRPITQRSTESMVLVVRAASNPGGLAPLVQRELKSIDNRTALSDIATLDEQLARNLAYPRLRAIVLGIIAGIALVLATIGIYGVVAQNVLRRFREISIRMALGAERSDVLKMIVRQGVLPGATGIAIGLIGSAYLMRFLKSMLFDVTPTDPATFGTVSVVILALTALASYIPARRATLVDPIGALKQD